MGRLPAPHPALPWSSHLPGLSQLCPPCVGLGTGMGAGAEPPDPRAGLGAWGRAKGRQRWQREQPIAPLHRAGLSCPSGEVGFVTDGSRPPSGGECQPGKVWPVALTPSALALRPGGQRLVYLPNKPGEGGTGPPPCSDAHLGTVSPCQPQTHVGAHGSLLPLLCQCWAKHLAAPGQGPWDPLAAPTTAAGCRGAGWVWHSRQCRAGVAALRAVV